MGYKILVRQDLLGSITDMVGKASVRDSQIANKKDLAAYRVFINGQKSSVVKDYLTVHKSSLWVFMFIFKVQIFFHKDVFLSPVVSTSGVFFFPRFFNSIALHCLGSVHIRFLGRAGIRSFPNLCFFVPLHSASFL